MPLIAEKLLRSAVANAETRETSVDSDDLVVSKIYVNEGPREKRVQPAPMGRAYRIQKRKAHVTVHVSDEVKAVNERSGGAEKKPARDWWAASSFRVNPSRPKTRSASSRRIIRAARSWRTRSSTSRSALSPRRRRRETRRIGSTTKSRSAATSG